MTDETRPGPTLQPPGDAGSSDDDELDPGTRVRHYVIDALIARGGCGAVYRAQNTVLGRHVAIKVLHRHMVDSVKMVTRFIREARAVNAIRHPNIVDIHEFGRLDDGRPFHVMELVHGVSLDEHVRTRGPLSMLEAVELLEGLCSAVDAAHRHSIVHRDLKPSNVLVDQTEQGRVARLTDFGIAKLLDDEVRGSGITTVGRVLGTPVSMAPEQITAGLVGPTADVYALGVVAFFTVTGRYPFSAAEPAELQFKHLHEPPPNAAEFAPVSAAFASTIRRALAKRPEDRFASAQDLFRALQAGAGATASARLATRDLDAIGIFVCIRPSGGAHDEVAALDDLVAALDLTHASLGEDYAFPVHAGNVALALRLLPADAEAAEDVRRGARADAVRVARLLADRPSPNPSNKTFVSVRSGKVRARTSAVGVEFVAGRLLNVNDWPTGEGVPEVLFVEELA